MGLIFDEVTAIAAAEKSVLKASAEIEVFIHARPDCGVTVADSKQRSELYGWYTV
jgi:hypothetical protein